MSKNYREKIEEHRQSIETEEQKNSRMSRSSRHIGKKQKERKNPLMKILTVIFIGIPLMILIYVWAFYNPGDKEAVEVEDDSVVELQTNNTASSKEKNEDQTSNSEENEQTNTDSNNEEVQQADEGSTNLEEQDQATQQSNGQTLHTVQPNENLYRISMKYYNDPSGVEKIMAANNLSSESISVGQTLIIPE